MRKLYSILFAVIISASVYAQAPQKMSYQAVIRNSSDALVTNTNINMQISILQGSISGTAVYVETYAPSTNANGLVSIEIGGGTLVSGSFADINWANGPYFVKTETDPDGATGGIAYSISGTSQLLSVPYALAAGTLLLNKNGKAYDTYMKDDGTYIGLPRISVEYPFDSVPSVTDVDGNTYGTVKIGTQVWMTENLRTTKYNDNTAIPLVTDNTAWSMLTTPAYCNYNNTTSIDTLKNYGRLYNWYTVETNKLCPAGWHVPSDTEWTKLTDYLGAMAGGRMKKQGTWSSPNTDAINDSRFSALPGGPRHYADGSFYGAGDYGYWWSATESDASYAYYRYMLYINAVVYQYGNNKSYGFSVRCVRD